MAKNKNQVVQPEVSRKKFDNEISEFYLIEDELRKKGIICLRIDYPTIEFAFVAHQLKPAAIAFAASIDFTNYDVEPPSIVFIDALTSLPITIKEMNVQFFQRQIQPIQGVQGMPGIQQIQFQQMQPILMVGLNDRPFLCIPGVREYHNHPAHTGNPWLLHRTKGEGKLAFILDQLYNHSIPFVRQYSININVGILQQ